MEEGVLFPNTTPDNYVDVVRYDVGGSYTWEKPPDAKFVFVQLVGGAAGGGSGRKGADGTSRQGGRGGSGGGYICGY